MSNLDKIIVEAIKSLTCPVCGRSYHKDEIKLRGFVDDTCIIQTICDNGHPPIVTMFIATTDSTNIVARASSLHPINLDDAILVHQRLEDLKDSFNTIWNK